VETRRSNRSPYRLRTCIGPRRLAYDRHCALLVICWIRCHLVQTDPPRAQCALTARPTRSLRSSAPCGILHLVGPVAANVRAHMDIKRYGTVSFFLALSCTLASCAAPNGMLRRANVTLSPCLQKGQSRMEVRRCLQSADFAEDHIYEKGNSLWANDCWPMFIPLMSACVMFDGDFDEQGSLTKWRLESYADGP